MAIRMVKIENGIVSSHFLLPFLLFMHLSRFLFFLVFRRIESIVPNGSRQRRVDRSGLRPPLQRFSSRASRWLGEIACPCVENDSPRFASDHWRHYWYWFLILARFLNFAAVRKNLLVSRYWNLSRQNKIIESYYWSDDSVWKFY